MKNQTRRGVLASKKITVSKEAN